MEQQERKVRFGQKVLIHHPTDPKKFLILTRDINDRSRPGDYDLPGGSVRLDETHDKALQREVHEETGLTLSSIKPVFVNSRIDHEHNLYIIYIGYSGRTHSTLVRLNKQEHSKYEWITIDELRDRSPNHILLPHIEAAFR